MEVSPRRRFKAGDLAWQALGAIPWGIFLSVATDVVIIFGVPLWIPLLIWREYRRARRYGFFLGFGTRVLVIAAVVTAAIYYPAKSEDRQRLDGLSGTTVTLSEIQRNSRFSRFLIPEKWSETRIILPSLEPTLRQTIQAIEAQTPLKCRIGRCATNGSNLQGYYILSIEVAEP